MSPAQSRESSGLKWSHAIFGEAELVHVLAILDPWADPKKVELPILDSNSPMV